MVFLFCVFLIVSISFVSAGFFSDLWKKIFGEPSLSPGLNEKEDTTKGIDEIINTEDKPEENVGTGEAKPEEDIITREACECEMDLNEGACELAWEECTGYTVCNLWYDGQGYPRCGCDCWGGRPRWCVDSDYGHNPFVQGMCTDIFTSYSDQCLDSTRLTEYYCEYNEDHGSICSSEVYTCESGYICENGACRIPCWDSDDGINYSEQGECYEVHNGSFIEYSDQCLDSTRLTEYYCEYNGDYGYDICSSEIYPCESGYICENGACTDQFCGNGLVDESLGEECEGNSYCGLNEECMFCQCVSKHEPFDTNCPDNNGGGEYIIHGNQGVWSCNVLTVRSPENGGGINFLDFIVDDALDCCSWFDRNVSQYNRQYCEEAQAFAPQTTRDCLTRFIAEGLHTGSYNGQYIDLPWINDYFYPEMCCGDRDVCDSSVGVRHQCLYKTNPPGPITFNEYIQGLGCAEGSLCKIRDLPALLTSELLNTGTCVDWAFLTTTLLRKTGYHFGGGSRGDVILYATSQGHRFNLVWMDQFGKWVVLDYGRLYFDPKNAWYDNYCGNHDSLWWRYLVPLSFKQCGHENDDYSCDRDWMRDNVLGCD